MFCCFLWCIMSSDKHRYESLPACKECAVTIKAKELIEKECEGLKKIKASGDKVEIEPMDMTKLMPYNLDEFYRYMGGLTTPACNEIVTFTIFKEAIKLSRRQLEQFYQLTTLDGNGGSGNPIALIDTFRPVQPLNGRTVYYADLKLRPHHDDWESAPYCGIYYK